MHAYEFGLTPTSPKFGLMPILIFGLTTTYEIWTNAYIRIWTNACIRIWTNENITKIWTNADFDIWTNDNI